MQIKWLGHACFQITGRDGTSIITDPYATGYRDIINYAPVDTPGDVVTVSHQHGDHNAVDAVLGKPEVVDKPGDTRARGIQFRGVSAFHDKSTGAERGPNTIYCFEVDSLRLCHLGDLGHPLDNNHLAQIGPVDVVFLPTGGPIANLDLGEAIELFGKLGARLGIAMHFKNDKCFFPTYGAADLTGQPVRVRLAGGSELDVSREGLPATPEIVVLEPAR